MKTKLLLIVLALVLMSCQADVGTVKTSNYGSVTAIAKIPQAGVWRVTDQDREITCYILVYSYAGGITCLRDE